MLELTDYITLFLLGSIGAFVAGFLGVGGGIIYIPILDYFLYKIGLRDDILVKGILANSLFTIIFSGTISSIKQYKLKNFFPREILYTALPGLVSSILMTYFIKTGSWYSKDVFNIVFVSMLFIIIVRMFFSKPTNTQNEESKIVPSHYSFTGFFAGFITALSGLGGGILMTPIFTDAMKLPIKKASSISNGVIPFFAIAIGIYNLSSINASKMIPLMHIGYIVIPIVSPMIAATFLFAPIGVKISQNTKPEIIRWVFASFVGLIFLKLVYAIFF